MFLCYDAKRRFDFVESTKVFHWGRRREMVIGLPVRFCQCDSAVAAYPVALPNRGDRKTAEDSLEYFSPVFLSPRWRDYARKSMETRVLRHFSVKTNTRS